MDEYRQRLRDAVQALIVHSPHAFSWFGRRTEFPSRRKLRKTIADDRLREAVREQLYSGFYCRGIAGPAEELSGGDRSLARHWTATLSEANRGAGCLEDGWSLLDRRDAVAVVRKNGLTIAADISDLVIAGKQRTVSVRLPKELLDRSPGFYIAVGDKPLDADAPVFRVYWNLRAGGARPFIAQATESLNRLRLPFRLKVLDEPHRYNRCDAAVLYLRTSDRSRAYRVIESLASEQARHLKALTPAFAKPIAAGVAIAEQPPGGQSFGVSRTAIVAAALVQSWRRQETSLERRMARVAEAFERDGIDLQRPYLNPGSKDVYPCL